jgi:hypothetical protein
MRIALLRRCWSRSARFLILLCFFQSGCSTGIAPLGPTSPLQLEHDQGLLILHVDSDVPIETLRLDRGVAARSVARGEHVWIVRAAAGRYRWTGVQVGAQAGRAERHRLPSEDEFRFAVEAGKINYPGALIIRSPQSSRSVSGNLRIRNRNHAAMAIRELLADHASLLESLPLHYAGLSGDRFLEYYQRMRDESR